MRGHESTVIALSTSAFALVVLAGCYAKSVPMPLLEPSVPLNHSPGSRPTLLAGVRAATHGDNIERLHPERLTQRLAERLADANIFSDVVYPLTVQSPAVPDVIFEVSVSSIYDLHPVSNLAKDIAVGLSVLLLQPVLPTVYDLQVELATSGSTTGGDVLLGRSRTRFEFNWLRASDRSIEQWHREATDRAIDELVKRIGDRYGARPEAGTPGSSLAG